MLSCFLSRYYCIVNNRVIVAFINSSLYSYETYTQVKEMDNLNLFIDYHYKYIVSIIRVKHILTLHLSTANWRIKLTTGCCCKNAASHYAISFYLVESIPQFLELWPIPMHVQGISNFTLLYRNATTYGIKHTSETGLMVPFHTRPNENLCSQNNASSPHCTAAF